MFDPEGSTVRFVDEVEKNAGVDIEHRGRGSPKLDVGKNRKNLSPFLLSPPGDT